MIGWRIHPALATALVACTESLATAHPPCATLLAATLVHACTHARHAWHERRLKRRTPASEPRTLESDADVIAMARDTIRTPRHR